MSNLTGGRMGAMFEEPWADRHMLITQRLRHRRAELGLTQKQVVTRLGRAGVQTTNRALSSLEHGAGVDIGKLPELAAALDCTITYLVGLTADPHKWVPDEDPQSPGVRSLPAPDRSSEVPVPVPPQSLILGNGFPERKSRRVID